MGVLNAAILWQPLFSNVHASQHFDARHQCIAKTHRWGGRQSQATINPKAYPTTVVAGLDMYVGCAVLQGFVQQ
jgi:hypothetical protein